MANLKEIRRRITSVRKTRQVTAAMKMVSAAKLRKAQENIIQFRPYANKLAEILSLLRDTLFDSDDNVYVREKTVEKILLIAITSNRGLCGAFNANIIRTFNNRAKEKYPNQLAKGNVHAITIGKKGNMILAKSVTIFKNEVEILDTLSFEKITEITMDVIQAYLDEKYDKVEIIYNQFKNIANQIITIDQFLPIQPTKEEELQTKTNYIFEPDKPYIIKEIIPQSLITLLHKALLDSIASEHGARVTAMHKATDNAGELLRELKLNYNKARQAAITNEILEIVTGANALKK